MAFFGLLESLGITQTIPTYNQEDPDPIDLQIKSLLYLFKRLRINNLAGFLDKNDSSLKYVDNCEPEEDLKLDQRFNVEVFLKLLVTDEYRILVDFIKNKFRLYCIVTENPNNSFPEFRDWQGRRTGQFKFLLFPILGISIDYIVNILSGSDIYCEHFIYLPYKTRVQLVLESIKEAIPIDLRTTSINITLTQREKIIRGYLTKLAFTVQLQRIYQEHIKLVLKSNPSSPIKLKSKPSVPRLPTYTTPRLSPRKSMNNLRPSSPTRQLKPKPSIPRFQLEELYNPVVAPTSVVDEISNDSDLEVVLYPEIYEKCKVAILERLKRNKSIL